MAAELPDASDPSHKPLAPATTTTRRVFWTTVATLVVVALSLALRVLDGDRGGAVFLGVSYMNLALLLYAVHRSLLAPEGSPARGRAKLAAWLLTTTLTAACVWKFGEELMLPLGLKVAAWGVAAATLGGGFCVLFLHDDEKRSAESLIMGGCERDGGDLSVLAS